MIHKFIDSCGQYVPGTTSGIKHHLAKHSMHVCHYICMFDHWPQVQLLSLDFNMIIVYV